MEDFVCARSPREPARRARFWPLPVALAALLVSLPSTLAAFPAPQQTPQEEPDSARADTLKPILLDPINVTATRDAKGIFETAAPVSVVDSALVREQKPNNAADLVRALPGIDINGVGANQQRPTIRGQRGQRILLLDNGLRLNNAR
jgi:outer membrane cobalamin receptor